jgi:SAM-dependent methyltransferase
MTDVLARIGAYWNDAAATYEQAAGHHPQTPLEWAVWRGVLARLLPPAPAEVLDVGAGTGVLSLAAAHLGHTVTALDLAPAMLQRLRSTAAADGVEVITINGRADEPPPGPWDAVMSRHLMWTLPDPVSTLRSWRAAAPHGRLLLLESVWGKAADPVERGRIRAGHWLRQLRGTQRGHGDHYDQALRAALPLADGATPEALIEVVTEAGWPWPRIERLADVEWAMSRQLPMPDRLLGVNTAFAITAD